MTEYIIEDGNKNALILRVKNSPYDVRLRVGGTQFRVVLPATVYLTSIH